MCRDRTHGRASPFRCPGLKHLSVHERTPYTPAQRASAGVRYAKTHDCGVGHSAWLLLAGAGATPRRRKGASSAGSSRSAPRRGAPAAVRLSQYYLFEGRRDLHRNRLGANVSGGRWLGPDKSRPEDLRQCMRRCEIRSADRPLAASSAKGDAIAMRRPMRVFRRSVPIAIAHLNTISGRCPTRGAAQ